MQVMQGIHTFFDAVMRLVSSGGELPKTADLLKVAGGRGQAEGVSGDFMTILAELSAGGDTNEIAIPVNNGGGMIVLLIEITPDALTADGNLTIPAKLALMGDDGEIIYLPVFVHITDGEHEIAAGNQPATLRIERENRPTELTEFTEYNQVSVPGSVFSLPPPGMTYIDIATAVSFGPGEHGEISIPGDGIRIETDHPLVFRDDTTLPEQVIISAPVTPEQGQKSIAGKPRVEGDKYGVTDTTGDAPPPVPQGTTGVEQAVVHNPRMVGEQNTDGVVTFKLTAAPAEQTNGVLPLVSGDTPLVHLLARYAESGNPIEIELVVPRGELLSTGRSAVPAAGTHQWRLVLADLPEGHEYRDMPTGAQDSRGSTDSLLISTHREVINRLAVLTVTNPHTSRRDVNIQGLSEHEAAYENAQPLSRIGLSDAPETSPVYTNNEVPVSSDSPGTSPVPTNVGVPDGPDAPEGATPQATSYGTAAGKSASLPALETHEVSSTTVNRDLPAQAAENSGIVQETVPQGNSRETPRAQSNRTFAYQAQTGGEGNHQGRAVTNDSPHPGQVPSARTGGEGEGTTTAPDSDGTKVPQSGKEVMMKSPVERRDVDQPVRDTSGPGSPEPVHRDIGGQRPFTRVAVDVPELFSSRGESSGLTAREGDVVPSLSIEPGVQVTAVQGTSEPADSPGVFSLKSATVPARLDSDMNEYEIINTIVRHARFMTRNGRSSAVIRLEPANLGRVKLDIVTEQSRVTGRIIVESTEVKEIVQHGLRDLIETLSQNGLKVESFDVQVGHNDGTDAWAQWEQLRQHAEEERIRTTTAAWTRDAGGEGTTVVPRSTPARSIDSHMLDITV